MKALKFIITFSLLIMLTTACSWATDMFITEGPMTSSSMLPFVIDSEVTVSGTVSGTIDDCAFDGICALVLDVNGETVNVIWAEGMLQCQGQYAGDIAVGDTVDAFGIARDDNSLSICPSPDYYVQH